MLSQTAAANAENADRALQALVKDMSKPLPTDAEMILALRNHVGCFEDILKMAGQDSARGIWRISPDFLKTTADFLPTAARQHDLLPDARWATYRELFVCADLSKENGGIEMGSSRVSFLAAPRGFAGFGAVRMFVWSEKPITPFRNSLDKLFDEPQEATPNVRVKHIKGPWYLELDVE